MQKPPQGSITIQWFAIGDPDEESGEYADFDWKLHQDPPGLSDDEMERLFTEIAERI